MFAYLNIFNYILSNIVFEISTFKQKYLKNICKFQKDNIDEECFSD